MPVLMAMRELSHEEIGRVITVIGILNKNPTFEHFRELTSLEKLCPLNSKEALMVSLIFYNNFGDKI